MQSLREFAAHYDGFLIDLWGVVHDGTALYPHALGALQFLATQRKPVVFLSNAPRRAAKAQQNLTRLGIDASLYRTVITSGEVAHAWLASAPHLGARYYYLGLSKDEDILDGLAAYTQVASPAEAEFVLNTGYETDFQPHAEILPVLQQLLQHNLPILCVNPDLEVVKQDGTQMLCAGSVAAEYARMGGSVHYVGKPHKNAYEAALSHLPEGKILMIGDNPLTDILGAKGAGIDALLITGGVLHVQHGALSEAQARTLCAQHGAHPTYVLPWFSA
jgi:HAD superfamily hydrolase (TIGR01459 family)